MFSERLKHLAFAANGRLLAGQPEMLVNGVFTDTRKPIAGGLFIALRGDNFDGNSFARAAIEQGGAAAAMLDCDEAARDLPAKAGVILVADTREGYLGIAAAHRRKLGQLRWFGITGSVGKSTTKEMLAHILEHGAKWQVHKNQGNFNNAVGLPHTMLGATRDHQAAVVELGTNHPGEIRQLAAAARPDIAIITCAAACHLEAFGTVENVAKEKGEILSFQGPNDWAVLNGDSPHLPLWRGLAKGKVLTFGTGADADVYARNVRLSSAGCSEFLVCHGDELVACRLRVPGTHQISNALAAITAAIAGGVPLVEAVKAIMTFEGVARRFSISSVGGFTLIDDAYNASPASFTAALETLRALPAQRRYVVAGDMLELGARADEEHRELGRQLAACGLSGLVTVGELARAAGDAAVTHGLPRAQWTACETPAAAARTMRTQMKDGDAVLVKGSHGVHLEECCELLVTRA